MRSLSYNPCCGDTSSSFSYNNNNNNYYYYYNRRRMAKDVDIEGGLIHLDGDR